MDNFFQTKAKFASMRILMYEKKPYLNNNLVKITIKRKWLTNQQIEYLFIVSIFLHILN